MKEGYSREAFDANEEKIDEARDLARQKPFSGRADPSDIMSAKFNYLSGKQERERLFNLAHDEALVENQLRSEKQTTKIGDLINLKIETESGNKYIIQKNKQGDKYLIANFNNGTIGEVGVSELSDVPIVKGESLSLGSYGHTTRIKNASGRK